jgi:hypothetical protein
MTARFFIAVLLMANASRVFSAEPCPPTNLNRDWSVECFEGKSDSRRVKADFLKNLRPNRYGMTTILIAEPRELVAVDRNGKLAIPGIRHTGDFDYPNAHLGIGRFYSSRTDRGRERVRCGYFEAGRFRVIVPARFDHCAPFEGEYGLACTGCVSYCSEPDCQDSILVGGKGTMLGSDGSVRKTFAPPTLDTVCASPDLLRISKLSTGAAMLRCQNGPDDPFSKR